MNPHEELAKRQSQAEDAIGRASYERYQCSRIIESKQRRIAELDEVIGGSEVAISEIRLAMKDFNDYMAETTGAMTLEQLGETIKAGGEPEAGTRAIPFTPEEPEAKHA